MVKLILKSEGHFNRNTSNLSFTHIKCLIIDIQQFVGIFRSLESNTISVHRLCVEKNDKQNAPIKRSYMML